MATETIPSRPLTFLAEITHVSKNDKDRRIVAGYGSLDIIDRQGERITKEAMQRALDKFMSNPEFANTHVMHGNLAVGKVIPKYKDRNGVIWETRVTDTGTFIVSELRDDIKRAEQVWQLIQEGKLKSYSVGGLALSPKEQVCTETGQCHFVINEIEIHEFSYVDRPAVKGADFIIVKSGDSLTVTPQETEPPKSMTCPLKKSVPVVKDTISHPEIVETLEQTYKEASPKEEVIIMTEAEAEAEVSEVTDAPEQEVKEEPEVEAEEAVEEAEKADATPTMLELKAKLDIIENKLDQLLPAPKEEKFDYPPEDVKALQDKFGEEETLHLLTILGDNYTRLLDKADEEETPEEPEAEAEPEAEPEAPIEAETVEEEKVDEPEPEVEEEVVEEATEAPEVAPETESVEDEPATEKSVPDNPDELQVAMEAKLKKVDETLDQLAEYAKVQKRTPGPTTKPETGVDDIFKFVSDKSLSELDELAQRGA
jgi:hypothetical protein